ncbi:hypothetical protein TrLO_g10887 [Triparma laevis f. longispina]|uniref:Uncharacterized protein n=1 Tax=Triparma laevis f. longispina TaxID=1714387 RepID=A0A9W7C8H1_9STRA|nr:hypothetical protein TrLO_g10887 [Triparma laevis f. longispina]
MSEETFHSHTLDGGPKAPPSSSTTDIPFNDLLSDIGIDVGGSNKTTTSTSTSNNNALPNTKLRTLTTLLSSLRTLRAQTHNSTLLTKLTSPPPNGPPPLFSTLQTQPFNKSLTSNTEKIHKKRNLNTQLQNVTNSFLQTIKFPESLQTPPTPFLQSFGKRLKVENINPSKVLTGTSEIIEDLRCYENQILTENIGYLRVEYINMSSLPPTSESATSITCAHLSPSIKQNLDGSIFALLKQTITFKSNMYEVITVSKRSIRLRIKKSNIEIIISLEEEELKGDIESDYLRFILRHYYISSLKTDSSTESSNIVNYLSAVTFRVSKIGVEGWGGRGVDGGKVVDGWSNSVIG